MGKLFSIKGQKMIPAIIIFVENLKILTVTFRVEILAEIFPV